MKNLLFTFLISIFLLSACEKDKTSMYNPSLKADLSVEFDNVAGSADLQLNTGTYTNASSQSFKVTKLKYYVSNFQFTNVDGSVYTVPQNDSYFLIDESVVTSRTPTIQVPEGEYMSVSFVIGVDSLRNTTDVSQRTGVLDVSGPATDMYWSWNSGYIFFKIDGTSPVITAMGGVFQLHVGGYGGYSAPTTNNLRKITIDLLPRGTPKVKSGKTTNVHLLVDVTKALKGTTNVDFTTTFMVHSPTAGAAIANNYAAMFTHDHTEN